MFKKNLFVGLAAAMLTTLGHASPYSINLSTPIIDKDPSNFHGLRGSIQYEPPAWVWEHLHIFFDGSIGHWWTNQTPNYRIINIFSIAPVLRYYVLKNTASISPFVDISIGLSYLSKTRIADRNLGEHFSFQDQLGLGAAFGQNKKLAVSVSAVHYSNGSLSAMNAGITIPLMLNVAYRF